MFWVTYHFWFHPHVTRDSSLIISTSGFLTLSTARHLTQYLDFHDSWYQENRAHRQVRFLWETIEVCCWNFCFILVECGMVYRRNLVGIYCLVRFRPCLLYVHSFSIMIKIPPSSSPTLSFPPRQQLTAPFYWQTRYNHDSDNKVNDNQFCMYKGKNIWKFVKNSKHSRSIEKWKSLVILGH